MYRQILINPDHRFLQNIIWRDSPKEPLQCLQLNTVSYGTNFAPFVATRVLNEIATLTKNYPLASNAFLQQTYVDDILAGCNELHELPVLHNQLINILKNHGFSLHKFASNSTNFMQELCCKNIQEIGRAHV